MAKPSLIVRKLEPENKETPIQFIDSDLIDNKLFFRRNHFSYPKISHLNYWLPVNGFVTTPTIFSMEDIYKLSSKTIHVVLECAGNKRHFFEPNVFGEQWEKGAISEGYWQGVPLRTILMLAGIKHDAKEVLVEGYDYGVRTDSDNVITYSRSLPLEKALHPDTIIAYEYNGQPIPFKHGFPLRLIVPQWYGVASVKWIKQISVIDTKFNGPFQAKDYVYYPNKENDTGAYPVTRLNVNSTIQKPLNRDILNTGKHMIKGIAWTGAGIITKVEISLDCGKHWFIANMEDPSKRGYGWASWTYEWTASKKGEYTIMTRATDSSNRVQPATPFWNQKGYGYNAIDKIKVRIE